MNDCRYEGEASVKVTSRNYKEVGHETSHRIARSSEEASTVKATE